MKLLGAILAGGRAQRFGTDKAEALIDGQPMIALVAERLGAQVDRLVICGRSWGALPALPDRPRPDMGPLGGLAAALHYAAAHGFDAVLTSGCDLPDLPDDLSLRLAPGPAVVAGQQLLGLWPSALAPNLAAYLETATDLSLSAWMREAGVRGVRIERAVSNINTPADLEAFRRRAGPRSSR